MCFTCVNFITDSCSYVFTLLFDEPEQITAHDDYL